VDKSITSKDYRIFLKELKAVRKKSGLSQIELAERIGETQSFVSKCERGERRIDIAELRWFCRAFDVSMAAFVQQLEAGLPTPAPKLSRRNRHK